MKQLLQEGLRLKQARTAGTAMFVLAGFHAAALPYALIFIAEKTDPDVTNPFSLAAMMLLAGLVVGLTIWIGLGMRKRKRVTAGVAIAVFLTMGSFARLGISIARGGAVAVAGCVFDSLYLISALVAASLAIRLTFSDRTSG